MTVGGFLLRLGRAALYLGLTLPLMPAQAALLGSRSPLASRLPVFYHRLCCRVLGLRISRRGAASATRPTLFVANHTSYLDIPILSTVIEGSFVAKSEIARWPFFGWLAKLQRTVFVDRQVRSTREQRDAIKERLERGGNLILFPEATSSDGVRLLPFKSALLSAADYAPGGEPLQVQPVTVAYVRLDGMPLGRFYRPFFAWYGDMRLGSHLWNMLGLGTLDVTVIFHRPVTLAALGSRKALCEHCQRVIAAGLSTALAGRLAEDDAGPVARAAAAMIADAAGVG